MRRALSLFAAAVVMLVSTTGAAAPDASAPDASKGDSGITTMPSPNNPTIPLDSGTDSGPNSSSDDNGSGGCNVVASTSSDGWSTVLGLCVAASILVTSRLSRRRRNR